ncbi:MAG: cation:proton antiporter [Verrucomicrobiales bacterium]|jgi:CPA2 family monovalent cation:H+ antiporter-2|nr:cation:proton antiporter [Verrucomicrobiales bacterium]
MTPIEVTLFVILLLMIVPGICRKLGHASLIYPVYIVAGILFGALADSHAFSLLTEVGEFGFIILLFTIGLEIDLPNKKESLTALRNASFWMLVQIPGLTTVGVMLGFDLVASLLAATALCACSVGMTYHAWQNYPHRDEETKRNTLLWMVALEVLAVLLIATADAKIKSAHYWQIPLHLIGIMIAVALIAYCAQFLAKLINRLLEFTTNWRVHFIALLVFAVAAIGERLGLSAPKTAFFFGLFISGATHEGVAMEQHLRPIAQQLLIPIFFVSLGILIPPGVVFSWIGLIGLIAAWLMLGLRYVLYKAWWHRWLPGNDKTFLIVCPNLTIVAVAVKTLMSSAVKPELSQSLLIMGFVISVTSIFLLPKRQPAVEIPANDEPATEAAS